MFCYQCEQTSKGAGCDKVGICGKEPEVADLQDLLVHMVKGLSVYVHQATQKGAERDAQLDRFVIEALFATVTNVSFDAQRIGALITQAAELTGRARKLYEEACRAAGEEPEQLACPAAAEPPGDLAAMLAQAAKVGIQPRIEARGADAAGLEELVLYGLKGLAAYADHARLLGRQSDEVDAFFHEVLSFLMGRPSAEELTALALRVGEVNIRVMGMLDEAHTGTYGQPVPTAVRITPVEGKAILVSGHDLRDLHALLEQTKGTGINVYTHSEMLPAHGYPELKKHAHLVGNYGGAWQDQRKEFDEFPGAILMTTNCIQRPRDSYQDRIFTAGLVSWPGVTHIKDQDFSPVIEAALAQPGFTADEPEQTIMTGFGHNAVLGVADKVIAAVKSGAIKHFFLIGGCDGAKSGRNYYTELAEAVPRDAVILTLACGKYRFNKLDFGDIGGIPRLLDIGQCNDAYSAVQIALALAQAFDTDVNGLPLSLVLSWFEQKAVVILLSLLHLGIRNIRLGPSLPAFITPAVLKVLVDSFNIMPTTTAEADLRAILS